MSNAALIKQLRDAAEEQCSDLGAHIQEGGNGYDLPECVGLLLKAADALEAQAQAISELERIRNTQSEVIGQQKELCEQAVKNRELAEQLIFRLHAQTAQAANSRPI